MNLPTIIAALVQAQNNLDYKAYADCFIDEAIVHDEGHVHQGKVEIREWIKQANAKYQTQMKPLSISQTGNYAILKAEVSGTFDVSPVVLNYHLELSCDLISSLKVTG
ncbi:ketosteroid isomerase-like protein [Pedobacter sp. AK017]|uniref:nuclear transport factor 2 family protein n=1 Tax=Pedobacter sp. AK017 TaxID=2723073 RepID=UPI001607FBE1|nr:nuclear transport factor 2 family protein [Pedobacter sp. AK017]MBB5441405.1 ketosteroid isomerase-like protein [Pedobacter sp. AK017]